MSKDNFIHQISEFNPTAANIEIKTAGGVTSTSGFGSAVISYQGSSINLQTHTMTSPFGFLDGVYANFPNSKPDPNVQLNLSPSDPKDVQALTAMQNLENLIVQTAFDKRREWNIFGSNKAAQQATLEQVRAKFSPMIRQSTGDYPPTFKISLMTGRDGSISTTCVDENDNPIIPSAQTIPKRSRIIGDIQAKQIWIAGDGKFGIKFKYTKIKVLPPLPSPAGGGGASSSSFGFGQARNYIPMNFSDTKNFNHSGNSSAFKPANNNALPVMKAMTRGREAIEDDGDDAIGEIPAGKCLIRDDDDE